MKAIQIKEPGALGIIHAARRPLGDGEARVRIRAVGVCAGDVSAYKGSNVTIRYPRILGHEAVGEIVEINGETNLRIGDRVALEPFLPCGQCRSCRKGRWNNCRELRVLGVHIEGAMAEEMNHPIDHLIPIPDDLDWELAVLTEPTAIAVHALSRAGVQAGEWVAISGAGSIGMLCAIACRDMGAKPIILDPIPEKRELAKRLGFEHVFDAKAADAVAEICALTGGDGVDAALECSGAQAGLNNALLYTANGGNVVVIGWPRGTVDLDLAKCIVKELQVLGSRNSYGEFPEAMEIIRRNRDFVRALVVNVHSLDRIPEAMIDSVQNPQNYMKLMATLEREGVEE